MMKLFIPVILGTAREGRQSEKVANFVLQEVGKLQDVETKLVDVRDFVLEGRTARLGKETDADKAREWSDIVKRANGLIVVSPEYNHGYPGELKMLLDTIYDEYAGKPVGFCGVSAGGLGGSRMVEQMRLVAIELRMISIREAVYFSYVGKLFDDQGNITDESYRERMDKFFKELLRHARTSQKLGDN